MSTKTDITWNKLGLIDYLKALDLQCSAHTKCVENPKELVIFSLEHPPVITLGQRGQRDHLLYSEQEYAQRGISVVSTERGGHVTAHMPGQLVVYPIVHLPTLRLMPKQYVYLVEQAVIDVLESFDIKAQRDDEYPGVWVGLQKICAIGIRIKDRVSLHGLALNVSNDLSLFESIVPCGILGRGVCSLQTLGVDVSFSEVEEQLVARLSELIAQN